MRLLQQRQELNQKTHEAELKCDFAQQTLSRVQEDLVKVRAEHAVSEKEKECVKAELKAQISVREELMRQLDRYLRKSEEESQ